ncbi:DUF6060 domain-containing protein [Acutalibacter sp. 1XD8-36]|uniref:DUF6060 domain-containing protein n=1 Tax=Acutalibacter sp. 1XD8-36 TaxID=2320852 RepID=UPI0014120D4A|nr:hypothetical protein [Acutalibacter sp. 1XD8-36]NBJ90879.1 hypothetical protein [Acutalibacter sp. 1XD8-36]
MKRVVSLVVALLLVFSVCSFASATGSEEWEVNRQEDGTVFLENKLSGETIVEAFRFDDDGQTVPVDLLEYVHELNALDSEQISSAEESDVPAMLERDVTPMPYTTYSYKESSSSKVSGSAVKVTADVKGPASITYGESITISDSYSAGVTLSSSIKRAIQIGASFTWQRSLSTGTNFSVTYKVPSGKTGYVKFTPYLNKTKGTLTRSTTMGIIVGTETYDAEGKSPIKLSNGLPDGTYAIVLK